MLLINDHPCIVWFSCKIHTTRLVFVCRQVISLFIGALTKSLHVSCYSVQGQAVLILIGIMKWVRQSTFNNNGYQHCWGHQVMKTVMNWNHNQLQAVKSFIYFAELEDSLPGLRNDVAYALHLSTETELISTQNCTNNMWRTSATWAVSMCGVSS